MERDKARMRRMSSGGEVAANKFESKRRREAIESLVRPMDLTTTSTLFSRPTRLPPTHLSFGSQVSELAGGQPDQVAPSLRLALERDGWSSSVEEVRGAVFELEPWTP